MSLYDLQDAKEQVRQSVDIVELIGGYMTLRRQGRNFVGLCPWHDDSRPSLQVNPERQSFKCWVCDIGGDIFSFVMRAEGLDFREALEMLAERSGIETRKPANNQAASQFDRRNLLAAMAWAESEFHRCLLESPTAEPARQYLIDRGIDEASVRKFRLGFSPDSWQWLLDRARSAGFSAAVLERVGLAIKGDQGSHYDRFRGRLLFSIRDPRSRCIAFGGRTLPSASIDPNRTEAKYINSPETPLFNKSSELYGLELARDGLAQGQTLVVMEGYTDVIMAHQHGITNAVAVLGTALGEKHIPLIRRFTDCVTLVLDGDEAGQRRTMQILDELLALFVNHEIDLRILTLPSGADPCDVISSQGSEAFRERLNDSLDALDYKIQAVTDGLALAPGTHRTALAVEELIATLARALPTDSLTSSSALVREQQVIARLSRQFGIGEEALRTRLSAVRREKPSGMARLKPSASPLSAPGRATISSWERELMELILLEPAIVAELAECLSAEDIEHETCRCVFEKVLELMHSGQIPTFDQLMFACDEADEKNLLVDCDESGREKHGSDPRRRIGDLLAVMESKKQQARLQLAMSQFSQKRLDPGNEDHALAQLFNDLKRKEELRRRQAGSAPTDG